MTAGRRALIVVAVLFAVAFGLPWSGALPEAAAQISVTAADPPTGEQGALNLSVIIKGKGFKNGAKASFYKTGTTNPAGVNVKSTKYVNATQLVATVDIADAAELAKFDIQVANTDGRTGKGTELFAVTAKRDTGELSAVFQDWNEEMVRSDGQGAYISPARRNDGSVYFEPTYGTLMFTGSASAINRSITFEFLAANNVRDALSDGPVECREYLGTPFLDPQMPPVWLPGVATVSWFMIHTEAHATYSEVNGVGTWASTGTPFSVRDMAVGSTAIVGLNLTFKDDTGREYWVCFNEAHWGGKDLRAVPGFVKVTRESPDTWVLQPLGAGDPRPFGAEDPRPTGGVNVAGLYAHSPEVRKVHSGGGCDLGDWVMPFKITFTGVR